MFLCSIIREHDSSSSVLSQDLSLSLFFFFKIYLFIFQLWWIFVAALRLSLVVVEGNSGGPVARKAVSADEFRGFSLGKDIPLSSCSPSVLG